MAGVTWAVGQRLTATALQDAFDFITPVVTTKPSATARNTTTTLADDPDLKDIALEVGVYDVEFVGFWTQTTTNTQKIKIRWAFSGTWNSPIRACYGAGFSQTAGPAACTESTFSAYVSDGSDAVYDQAAGGTFGVFLEKARNVTVTAAGNFSIQWAQSASSGNNTTLQTGSSVSIRRIS